MSKEKSDDSSISSKYEINIELQKMDVSINKTCIFRVKLRGHKDGLFKILSKKYKIASPNDNGASFGAYVEFDNDIFQKSTMLPKNSIGEFISKHVLLEILCDDEIVNSSKIYLEKYADLGQAEEVKLKIEEGPIS